MSTDTSNDTTAMIEVLKTAASQLAHADIGSLVVMVQELSARAAFDPSVDLLRDLIIAKASVEALAPALVKLPTAATPSTARAAQATENAWRTMADEFGLLNSTEVAKLLGTRTANRAYASDQRAAGRLLGIRRLNSYLYPGFQFDRANGQVKAAIQPLLQLAAGMNRSQEGVALWLTSPTTYFGGDRPVEHLDDVVRMLELAETAWGVEW